MRPLRAALAAAALASSLAVAPSVVAAPPGPKTMVALGDSFASGPLIPVQQDDPAGCLRSSMNYAHQVADELALALTDVTCSGAQTKDMWASQQTSPEHELDQPRNPAQLRAVRPDTDVVTLQIGGNDIGFVDLARTCAEGEARGVGCEEAVAEKRPFARITATKPKIAAVIAHIASVSDAAVYVLGYPGIFKVYGEAWCPAMAAPPQDAKYLRSIQVALNTMIRQVAIESGATYVDVYRPSAGHSACDLPVLRWVEPIVPVGPAFPVHPNLTGMTAIADILTEVIWPKGLPRRTA